MSLKEVPRRMVVIGAGVIGLELVRHVLISFIKYTYLDNNDVYIFRVLYGLDWEQKLLQLSSCHLLEV